MVKTTKIKKTQMEVMQITEEDTLMFVSYNLHYVKTSDGLFVYTTEEMMEVYGEDIFDKIKESREESTITYTAKTSGTENS